MPRIPFTVLAAAAAIALLIPDLVDAQLWRSPLLEKTRVRVDTSSPTVTSKVATEIRQALGSDSVAYESFGVAYSPSSELAILAKIIERERIPHSLETEFFAHLPGRRVPVEQLDRRNEHWASQGVSAKPAKGLYLVAFAFPTREAWLDELTSCGAEPVAVLQSETFVVRAASAEAILGCSTLRYLAWVDSLSSADRLVPDLFTEDVSKFWLQYVQETDLERVKNDLPAGVEVLDSRRSTLTGMLSVQVRAAREDLIEVASESPDLLIIVPSHDARPSDERQGQILAGHHNGVSVTQPGYTSWLQARGLRTPSNQQTVAVFDTGYQSGSGPVHHPDLDNPQRVIAVKEFPQKTAIDELGHGTMVAGIIAGDGTGSLVRDTDQFLIGTGVAPDAKIVAVKIFDYDTSMQPCKPLPGIKIEDLEEGFKFSRNDGSADRALISNHSWNGVSPGYGAEAVLFDEMVIDVNEQLEGEQSMTVVVSAGNRGAKIEGGVILKEPNSVAEPATAKNVIAVGSTENFRPSSQYNPGNTFSQPPLECNLTGSNTLLVQDATDIRRLEHRSGKGKLFRMWALGDQIGEAIYAHNVRIKPDLVAPGVRIFSTTPYQAESTYVCSALCKEYYPAIDPPTYHSYAQGTSFAAPAVAGGAALLYKWFLDRGTDPAPSLIKAAMIATADDLGDHPDYQGDHRPSYLYGWGRFNLDRPTDPTRSRFWVSETDDLAVGQQSTYRVAIDDPTEDAYIVLAWSDLPSEIGNSQQPLKNDLDLVVDEVNSSAFWRGNNFRENMGIADDGYSHRFTVGGEPVWLDQINTVEAVFIPANTFPAGRQLDLRVVAANVPEGMQSFSLYAYNTRAEVTIGETGQVTDLTHVPRTISLSRTYANPVVIAQPPSFQGPDMSVVRITDVTPTSFTMYLHEAPDRDGGHTTETVSYIVLEAGSWQLADGTQLEVGTLQTSATVGRSLSNQQWSVVSFPNAFGANPAVISQVQSNVDPHWVKTRQVQVTASSFLVALEEEEASPAAHGQETIGWLAISPGKGTWDGRAYEATATANAVTDVWYPETFTQSIPNPRLFAGMATYDGADAAQVRYRNLTSTGVEFKIEEDTTLDSEVAHTTEVVHYLVLSGDGALTASAN